MQLDFFVQAPERLPLQLVEHPSADYAPRTGVNARSADLTVAFAVDFNTAGERLTHRLSGTRYVGIPYGSPVQEAAEQLAKALRVQNAHTLNVAGNGIYTLAKQGVTQAQANQWVYDVFVLARVSDRLTEIRSGGQTGIDTAGLVAALALKVPAVGLYPKGFKRRHTNNIDSGTDTATLEAELFNQVQALNLK